VPATDIDSARTALRAGRPEELLGLAECGWLDAKGGIYRLDEPAGPQELAKDVAGFANVGTGGLLLVGFSTRKETRQRDPRPGPASAQEPGGSRPAPQADPRAGDPFPA
jgi:hypothetical protein